MAIRSRPDLSYAISAMGKEVTKRPKWVLRVGQHVLEYLNGTMDYFLHYVPCDPGDRGPHGDLPLERSTSLVELFSDISYVPQGEKSVQGIVAMIAGATVQWETSSQSCLALSTAEAELYSYTWRP